ncbi:MAG: hypothetical protein U0586_08285 [Candidatus Brocadiaceae bacterium]
MKRQQGNSGKRSDRASSKNQVVYETYTKCCNTGNEEYLSKRCFVAEMLRCFLRTSLCDDKATTGSIAPSKRIVHVIARVFSEAISSFYGF